MGVAAALAMFTALHLNYFLDRPDRLVSGLWCVLSTIVVMKTYIGSAYRLGLARILGVFVGAIVSSLVTSWWGADPWNLGISCFITLIVCCLLNIRDSVNIACMAAATVIILSGIDKSVTPWAFGFYRFTDSVIGIFIGLLVLHVLWPTKAATKMQKNLASILDSLAELTLIVGNLKLVQEPQIKRSKELIEKTVIDLAQDKNFLIDLELEFKTRLQTSEDWVRLQSLCEGIFKSIIALKGVYKLDLYSLLDDDLIVVAESTVQLISKMMSYESEMLKTNKSLTPPGSLSDAINRLSNELTRFRATKATRQFEFEYVEGFYVFFFQLKTIILQLQKVQELITKIVRL